jgi:hypothetical protein
MISEAGMEIAGARDRHEVILPRRHFRHCSKTVSP